MPDAPTNNPAQFYQSAPLLLVPDVTATAGFYRKLLGFKTDPGVETPDYSVVWRDNAAVHFAKGAHAPTGVRIFFWVKNVNALYAEVIRRRAAIAVPIGTRPYRVRDFSIRDPNGVMVVFGQDVRERDLEEREEARKEDPGITRPANKELNRVRLLQPVPELPVNDVQAAGKSYTRLMGFSVDWTYENSFAGISRDDARLFLRRRTPEEATGRYSVLVWLNMGSSVEVDQLNAEWKDRGVLIAEELRTAPYNLREFTAQDLDGNRFRVFYDLGSGGT
jgi:predicted lactoylglutathione lyase/catechol 2,3-dioxygenase-like lactoylglutathione lyase family enzyme